MAMSIQSLFLLAMAATAAGQSSRQNPVVMPFGLSYGEHTLGAWFSIPATIGNQKFELGISTSLSQSWVPGTALCAADTNVTYCIEKVGGTFDETESPTWKSTSSNVKITDSLLKGYYNESVSSKLTVSNGGSDTKLLGIEGVGDAGTDTITLVADTGSFKMENQAVGVISSGDRQFLANGYLSLQQMALSLYANNYTPSPTYHLFHGKSDWNNGTELFLDSEGQYNWGGYLLIFGGYDRGVMNLNTTQQFPLIETTFSPHATTTTPLPADSPLPSPDAVSYSMQLTLDNIIYRWTDGGKTDNSLLLSPTLAIIDSTTPWIWLPKSAHDTLISLTGATWNTTYNAYVMELCGYVTCTDLQAQASRATVDFGFQGMGDKISLGFDAFMEVRYYPANDSSVWILPIRELAEGAPVVLGKPFLATVHLWVDFAEMYWGMAQGNYTAQLGMESDVVGWDREGHPQITNTTILVQRGSATSGDAGGSSAGGAGGEVVEEGKSAGLGLKAIAGIAACGGAVLVALVAVGICMFRRKKKAASLERGNTRSESAHELRPTDPQKIPELPPHEGQMRPHELPQNQSAYTKAHELPQSPGNFPQAELAGGYHKPQELPNQGLYQPQQGGYYTPVTPVSPAYQYPPPQQGVYPPPPMYENRQGGPMYYEMDAGAGYPAR